MTESIASPFFTDRTWQGVFNTMGALVPSPTREAAIQGRLAQAGYDRARTDRTRQAGDAAVAAGNRLRSGEVDPGTLSQVIGDLVSGGDPQTMAHVGQVLRAAGGAAGAPPERMAQLFQGAGGDWGHTEVGTRYAEGVRSGDRRYATDQAQAGADRRLHVNTPEGAVTTVPQNSPIAPAGSTGPVTIQGRDTTRAGRAPMDINGADSRALDESIAQYLPEGEQLDQEAANFVRTRAAELYQQSRNMPQAAQRAVEEFMARNPPRVDSQWWPFSARRRGMPRPAGGRDPGTTTAPAAPTEGGAARDPREGATATNPSTGERRIFRGGQWVPLA